MKRLDPNRPRRWESILRRLPAGVPLSGVEVGVWRGENAAHLLEARPMLTLCLVDPWEAPEKGSSYERSPDRIAKQGQAYFDECYLETLRAVEPWKDRAFIYRISSEEAATIARQELARPTTPAVAYDFVFIDADHSYEGVSRDIARWLGNVRPGGWIGGHDVDHKRYPGVRKAVEEAFGDAFETDRDCTWFHRVPA